MLNIKKQSLDDLTVQSDNLYNDNANNIISIDADKLIEREQDFKIREERVIELMNSIPREGQLEPCIIAPSTEKAGYYDLLAGRHRKRACKELNIPVKCIIHNNLSEEQKELIVIETNINRNNDYLPSEIAWAWRHKKEILRSIGGGSSLEKIADDNSISTKKVYRYIRLTFLIKPLLDLVDEGVIPVSAGSELSYLDEKKQNNLYEYLKENPHIRITTGNVKLIKDNVDKDYDEVLKANAEKELSERKAIPIPDLFPNKNTEKNNDNDSSSYEDDNDNYTAVTPATDYIDDDYATEEDDEVDNVEEEKSSEYKEPNREDVKMPFKVVSIALNEQELAELGCDLHSTAKEIIDAIKVVINDLIERKS